MIRPLLLLPLLLALGCATTPRRPLVTHDDTGSGGGFNSLPPLQLQFFGQSAPIVTGSLGVPAYASTISATSITLSAASGANAVGVTTNGARVDVGAGASDYFTSNGFTISTPAPITSSDNITAANVLATDTFQNNSSALPLRVRSNTTAAAVTSSSPAILMFPINALDADDLLIDLQNSVGATRLKVDAEGDTTIAGNLTASGTSTKGSITLSAGTGTATVLSGARCVCTDTTANASVKCAVSGTTLTITGTGTDSIAYLCL